MTWKIKDEFNVSNANCQGKASLDYFSFPGGHRFGLGSGNFCLLTAASYSLMAQEVLLKGYKTAEFITIPI